MLQITNRQTIAGQSFDEYKAIKRLSFSGIKRGEDMGELEATPNMRLGTLVHQFMLEPAAYKYERHEEVIAIARELNPMIGEAIRHGQTEITALCDMHYQGLTLPYKGRIDNLLPDLVVDMKVSNYDIRSTIGHFGYDKQVTGYMLSTGCTNGIIVSYNRKQKKVQIKIIEPDHDWWALQVMKNGILNPK
jgi:hypothetical protein